MSRIPHAADLTDKTEVCGFNIVLYMNSGVSIPSFAAFCGDVLLTYCLKEEGNEQHQSKNLRISSEMLLKDHLFLSLSPVLSLLPSFNDAV